MAVVLIVEDEEQVRVLAEAIIQDLGHETLTAGTAEQALAVVQDRPDVDLLFTDIGLQQDLEGGLQLAKGIAAQKPGLPVLYTTGQGVTDGMRAMFADPFGFLPKPYTPDDLSTALGNLLALETSGPKSVETAGKKDRGGRPDRHSFGWQGAPPSLPRTLRIRPLGQGGAAPAGLGGLPSRRRHRRTLALEHLGAMPPALGHPAPRRLARGITGKSGHLLTVGGVSEEFVGRIDTGQMHGRALLADRQARADPV
jgi:CheY-like chemotaxis protein